MQKFYKQALIGLLCLVLASVLIGYVSLRCTYIHLALLPAADSALPWRADIDSDVPYGGHSAARIVDDSATLSFDITVDPGIRYPYAVAELAFRDRAGKPALVDLSRYSAISFVAKCAPANTLAFGIRVFEDQVSVPGDFSTYRNPLVYFSCSDSGRNIELDVAHLKTDQWWYNEHKLNLARQDYRLDKVAKLTFGSSFQSPIGTPFRVQLSEINLVGRDMSYLTWFGVFMLVAWSAYAVWFFRQHTRALIGELKDKARRDIPLVAYQQLSQELHRDKEKSAILHFMATEYVNAELDFDAMVAALGISRNKINDVLKAELGYTFSSYLNKLRLTEAARLLGEKEETSVAEIAYSVGYRNVSYFNKLFKEEYGCTPKTFKKLRDK